jgi:pimeloyl-ACP methyl ester carboxylesterase
MHEPQAMTWVLLRGLTREAAHWGDFAAALQQAWPQARVLALDLPGNGPLHAQRSASTIGAMVAWCQAELVRRGVQGPVQVLAMSLGAMVATEWAYRAPQQIAGCVLINTSFRPFSAFYHRLRPRNYGRLLQLMLGRAGPLAWERAILAMTSNQAAQRPAVLPGWVALRERHPVRAANAWRQLLAAARYRAQLRPPAVPLLLLASEQDGLVNVCCSRKAARHWGQTLQLHPWAGHDLPLDDPDWVIAQVLDWRPQVPR